MKRNLLLLLMVGAITFAGWVLIVRQKNGVTNGAKSVVATNANEGNRAQNNTWVSPVPNDPDPAYTKMFLERRDLDPTLEWRAPINFYGRVLYEDDKPAVGASIDFSWPDTSVRGNGKATTQTDSDGRFELVGRTGKMLTVRVSGVDGYPFMNGAMNAFEFGNPWSGRHIPNKANPVVFRWKKQGKVEPLFAWTAGLQVTNDGTVTVFQFQPAVVTEKGDLRLQCKLGPENPARHFDWEFSMVIPGGGFVAIDEEFPFLAPENGYVETVTFAATADDPGWKPGFVGREFYVRLSNPIRYGRIRVEFDPATIRYYKHSSVLLSFWINPSGSRVVEASKGEPMKIPREVIRRRDPWTGGQ